MERLTKELFDQFPNGEIFALGVLPNSPEGIFMTASGGMLRWVAVKGYANDWCIYCHWVSSSIDYVKSSGDKVFNETHIRRCVDCSDEIFKRYRY